MNNMENPIKYSKEIVLKQELSIVVGDNYVKVNHTSTSMAERTFFIMKSDWNIISNSKEDLFDLLFDRSIKKFKIQTPHFFELLKKEGYSERLEKEMDKASEETQRIGKVDKSTENLLVFFDVSSHLFWGIDNKLIQMSFNQNYLGGICNDRYDLEKVKLTMQKLQDSGLIVSYEEEHIPYYNADKKRNKAIKFIWTLPKEELNKVFSSFNGSYPSVRLKEYFTSWFESDRINK